MSTAITRQKAMLAKQIKRLTKQSEQTKPSKQSSQQATCLKKNQKNKQQPCCQPKLRVIAAQINPLVGDVFGNTEKIIRNTITAKHDLRGDVVVFPEMVVTGYPPEDLLLRPEFYSRVEQALKTIQEKTKHLDIYIVVGHPALTLVATATATATATAAAATTTSITTGMKGNKILRYNQASVIYQGKIIATYSKQQLPNYGVFDEKRYFTAGKKPCMFSIKGIKIALTICEDLWSKEAMEQARSANAQLMLSINASPFDMNKPLLREQIMGERAREGGLPLLYVNCVGGQDELVFDGGSMVLNATGEVVLRAAFFAEGLMPVDFDVLTKVDDSLGRGLGEIRKSTLQITSHKKAIIKTINTSITNEERVYQALVLGVRDYVNKNNFPGVIVSVSGGIDSALTLAIAVDALGKDRVETIYMPSRYSSALSEKIVKQQEKLLGTKLTIISIEPMFQAFLKSVKSEFKGLANGNAEENLQARCRGVLLMAFSNKKNLLVLSTGNKSEMAVGYATLYGDMVGGFCVLKDVPKTLVYKLAEYRNSIGPVIPQSVIRRAPSAELAPNQKDTDTLPPYPILDAILELYIEEDKSLAEIVVAGFKAETVKKVIHMVKQNEYKRRQSPSGVRITIKAFGRDRRYPITSGF